MAKAGTARETGHKVAEAALKKAGKTEAPDYFYMVAPPGEEELYLKGITPPRTMSIYSRVCLSVKAMPSALSPS